MKYKMIVTDMDDTLLNSEGKISSENKNAIMKAQKMGIKFVLASGRPTFAMKAFAKELELDRYESYMLSYNGAIITECATDKIWLEEKLTVEDAHKIYDLSRKHNVQLLTYVDEEIASETKSEYIDVEINLTGMPYRKIDCFKSTVTEPVVKCIMLEKPEYLKEVEIKLNKLLKGKYSLAISKPFFLEVMKKGIDKGASLLKLAHKLGIKSEEIISVGDSYNDMTMLEVVGMPVAVENARIEVKNISKFISTSHNDHALKTVIEKFIVVKTLNL
ncbi:MAG TPA: Cof-type HAD-IIB family hydrolase [Fusobacteriaceae bacterium]|nr:Cof-type HAD-IIB family hydrolase [Fusobacteriaceae bacterium]